MKYTTAGFTLMEMMVVLIIVSIIAAFSIANYENSITSGKRRAAILALQSIYAAQSAYFAKNQVYYPSTPRIKKIADINTNLGINIIEPEDVVIECFDPANPFTGNDFRCTAREQSSPKKFQCEIDDASSDPVPFLGGPCP